MVHYLKPVIVPEGGAKEWNDAVNSFDAEKFASQAQEAGVALYENLADEYPDLPACREGFLPFARLHRDIIARFGRFPHRNKILDRRDTAGETEYLAGNAPTFGQ